MRCTIDPPVLLELARRAPQPIDHQLVGPAALRSQTMSLLYRRHRDGLEEAPDLRAILLGITTIKIRLLGDRVSRGTAWRLATELALSDTQAAEYLAVTRLQADGLVALDPELRALADGVVPLLDPAVLLG